ncbi:MAG: proton-conducting transporter membrane subunit [Spirochaeta sp.]
MSDSLLVISLPLVPMSLAVLSILALQVFNRDITRPLLWAALLSVIVTGLWLAKRFWGITEPLYIPLSLWDYSTVLRFDGIKSYFALALATPALIGFAHQRILQNPFLRMVFLFYLTGCAGIVVTGDVFTFFIFYEMMIMAAYVLITVRNNFYAGIKYMIIGSVSSAFLLAGIILLYASAGSFHFSFVRTAADLAAGNIKLLMLLFSMAFFVKSAFFPASSWAATCHSATNPLVSAFLSSFTVFSGVYGLVFLVLEPAAALGYTPIFDFLRLLSVLTVFFPAVFIFLEPELKRCIAGSTVFTIGFIGILLSYQLIEYALVYMIIHAVYKSAMFLLLDHLQIKGMRVYGSRLTLIIFFTAIFFTAGFFPGLPYFLKYAFIEQNPLYRILIYTSMFLVFGSFFKFRYSGNRETAAPVPPKTAGWWFIGSLGSLFAVHMLLFPYYQAPAWYSILIDLAILGAAFWGARPLFNSLRVLHKFDTAYIFSNLNVELLLIMTLFFAEIAILRYVLP